MATMVKVGELSVDVEKLSDDDREIIEQYVEDGELTDDVIQVLAAWSKQYGSASREGGESKASKMKRMAAAGMKTGDIAKALGVRFQFVYNVLNRPSKKASN